MNTNQRDEEVWRLRKEGVPLPQIATRFRISRSQVREICRRKQVVADCI